MNTFNLFNHKHLIYTLFFLFISSSTAFAESLLKNTPLPKGGEESISIFEPSPIANPTFESTNTAVVQEGTLTTATVLDVNANDGDGRAVTYSLSGTDAADFQIDANTGELTFAAVPDWSNPADDNTDNIYSLTVTANNGTTTATQDLSVFVFPESNINPGTWLQSGADIDGEAAGDRSGTSVSISSDGRTVAIGAFYNDGTGSFAGHVRIYSFDGTSWSQLGGDIDGEAVGDQSGYSISLGSDGRTVAIGAPFNGGTGSNAGHVRIYSFDGSSWSQLGTDIDGEAAYDFSGFSVSLSSDGRTVAIGAIGNDGIGSDAGHVRIYSFNGSSWSQLGTDINGEAAGDQSGSSVSLSSDGLTVAIGAIFNDGTGTDAGHVRIYSFDGSSWTQLGGDIDGEAAGDQSGFSVSLSSDGHTVAIGAIFNDGSASDAGHVRIYSFDGNSWAQLGGDIDGESAGDRSGYSVSLSSDGRTIAIGAFYNDGTGSNAGHVRIYSFNDTSWGQLGGDIDGEAAGDGSGQSVSLSSDGRTVAIGARFNDGTGINAGHVRVYQINDVPVASIVTFSGTLATGASLTGSYDYADAENETESGTTFRWFRSDDNSGTNKAAIAGATSRTYTLVAADAGKYLSFEVTPNDGNGFGTAVESSLQGPILIAPAFESTNTTVVQEGTLTTATVLDVNANDGDGGATDAGVTYSLSGTDAADFQIDTNTGALTFTAVPDWSNPADDNTDNIYSFTVTADNGTTTATQDLSIFVFPESNINFGTWLQSGANIDGEAEGDESGFSVSLSSDGRTVAIGAPLNDGSGSDAGHVRIYSFNGTSWAQLGGDIDGEEASDQSGTSVSLSSDGRTVAIGASLNDGTASSAGHVRIYSFDGTSWAQLGGDIDGEAAFDRSGWSVSLSSDGRTVAIGAPLNGGTGSNAGHVRIYSFDGSSWSQLGTDIDGEAAYDFSGFSVSLSSDGRTVAIGATRNGGTGSNAGHVRIYSFNGSSWAQLGVDIDGKSASDQSGYSVNMSADGRTVAIGAINNAGTGFNAGHVRIYSFNGSSWGQLGGDIDGEAAGDQSGFSVNLSSDGRTVAIGANGNAGKGSYAGHVRIYSFNGTSWSQLDGDIDGEAAGDESGWSVSLSSDGRTVAIGARFNDGTGINAGHVRVYQINQPPVAANVTFSGTLATGATLTGSYDYADADNDIESGTTLRWFRSDDNAGTNKAAIAGATSSTYTLVVADAGKYLSFEVTPNNGNGLGTAVESSLQGPILIAPTFESTNTAVVQEGTLTTATLLDVNANDGDGGTADAGVTYSLSGTDAADFQIDANTGALTFAAVPDWSNPADDNTDNIYVFTVTANNGTTTATQDLSVFVFPESNIDGDNWAQSGVDIDGEASGDFSGLSVSISADGHTVGIGAYGNNDNGSDAGHVRIYSFNGTSWAQLGGDIDGEATDDQSGRSLSLSSDGRTVAIGALFNDGKGSNAGHVRIYSFDGSSWVQLGGDIDGEAAFDQSGTSVSLSSDGRTLAIGAPRNGGTGSFAGHVRIYSFDGNSWAQLGGDIDGESASDQSGRSVSLSSDGRTVAIGAIFNDGTGSSAGHVRIYSFDGTSWSQLGADIDGEAAGDQSGTSISLSSDGRTVAIGAIGNDGTGSFAGHVRVYSFDGTSWAQLGGGIDGEAAFDQSGISVSLSSDGRTVAIGANGNDGTGADAGHVRIYNFNGTSWAQIGSDISGEAAGDRSGWSVSLSSDGRTVAIGAPLNDGTASSAGHVRVYQINHDPVASNVTFSGTLATGATLTGSYDYADADNDIESGTTLRWFRSDDNSGANKAAITGATSSTYTLVAADADKYLSFEVTPNDGNGFGTAVESSLQGPILIAPAFESTNTTVVQEGTLTTATVLDVNANDGDGGAADAGVTYSLSGTDAADFQIDANTGALTFAVVPDWSNPADDNTDNIYLLTVTADNGTTTATQNLSVFVFPESNINPGTWLQSGADIDGEAAGDQSGFSVSLSSDGRTVAIGAYLNDDTGTFAGHVRIYSFDGTSWTQLGGDIDGEAASDFSGRSVSLSSDGRTVAIGATGNDDTGSLAGHVRIYSFNGTSWSQLGGDIDGEAAGDRSGWSISLSSDGLTVAIGAPRNVGTGSNAGHVRIYSFNGTSWAQLGSDINGEAAGDQSGYSMSLSSDGRTVAIGSPFNDGTGLNVGHVRIYSFNGSSWAQLGSDIDGEAAGDQSGTSVSISSDGLTVAIGAIGNAEKGSFAGHARIYSFNGTSWAQLGSDIDGEAASDQSGTSVSLSSDGRTVAIGAVGNDGTGSYAGHVRIYNFNGSSWAQLGTDIDGEATGDRSGWSVSLSSDGRTVAIGAVGNDGTGADAGHVRVYQINDVPVASNVTFSGTLLTGETLTGSYDYADTENDVEDGTTFRWFRADDNAGTNEVAISGATGSTYDLVVEDDSKFIRFEVTPNDGNGFGTSVKSNYQGPIVTEPVFESFNTAVVEEGTLITATILDVNANDGLGGNSDDGVTYSLNSRGTDAGNFQIDANTGEISLATGLDWANPSDQNADNFYQFSVFANNGNAITSQSISIMVFPKSDIQPSTWVQEGNNIDGKAQTDLSGVSVSFSSNGRTVAIGSPGNDDTGRDAGQVRVYSFDGTSWAQLGTDINGETASDQSGTSVSLSSDGLTVAISEPRNSGNGFRVGQVRIYTFNGTSWTQLGGDINGEASGDQSGSSVSLSSDGRTVAIGAIENDGNGSNAGHVRIYSFDANSWVQLGTDIDGESENDESGYPLTLSADGRTVAIGARGNDGSGTDAGHVRLYTFDGTSWTQLGADIDGESAGDVSGYSVSLSADGLTVAIGAIGNSGNGTDAGHVRIFSFDGNSWVQLGADIDGVSANDESGSSVSLSADGRTLAVGASKNENNGTDAGHVRVFTYNNGNWIKIGKDILGESAGDQSGYSVSMSADGRRLAIGSPLNHSASGLASGHVRVYYANELPVASNVSFSGTLGVGKTLSGTYDYSDDENDDETGTEYQWFRADDGNETNKVAITGATDDEYTLVDADETKFISFEVTPNDGNGAGSAVESQALGRVKGKQSITFNTLQNKTYGESSVTLSKNTDAGLAISYTSSNTQVATISNGNELNIIGAGSAVISANQSGSADYLPADEVQQTLTVNKATLTATADDQSRVYGEANPSLSISYAGFKNGEDKAVINTEPTISTSAVATTNVGTSDITLTGGSDNNYDFVLNDGTLTINKATLTATADDQSRLYGEANPSLSISYAGFKNGEDKTVINTEPTISTSAVATTVVGTSDITLTGGSDNNYDFVLNDGTLTINKATLTVTADDQSRDYGEANPSLSISYTGFKNGEDKTVLDTEPTISTSAVATTDVGTSKIALTGGSDDNYDFALNDGTLTINKAPLTVTANDQSKIYGDENPEFTFSYAGFKNGEEKTVLDSEPTISTTAVTTTFVGTAAITLTGGSADNYDLVLNDGTLTINKATLTAKADDKSREYGEANPNLTISYSGFIGGRRGDSESDLDTKPTITTTATATTDVGTSAISLSGGSDNNYDIVLNDGTLTINKATLTATADDQSKIYGDENPEFTFSYVGFKNGENKIVLDTEPTISTSAVATTDAGTSNIALTGGSDNNYDFALNDGTLTINKAPLTVTADDQSRLYGEADPAFTVSYDGFKNGEDKSVLDTEPSINTTATATTDAGTSNIALTGGSDDNYDFVLNDGTLTINKAPLTVTADDESRIYGDENPEFTFSYAGFKNGEDKTVLDTEPTISTVAGILTDVGTAAITLTGGSDNNYDFVLNDGTLTINKATLTATADDKSRVYGEANLNLTISYSGFKGGRRGDSEADLDTKPTITTTATSTTDVGTSAISLSGGSDNNYDFVLNDGTLTINKATLTATADDQSRVYGEANPSLSISYAGFKNGEDKTVINTEPAISTSAVATTDVGASNITLTGGSDNNYDIVLNDGTLTINKAPLTVTADDQSRVYGDENPEFTFSYAGFKNGEDKTVLGTEPTISTSAVATTDVGTSNIALTGGSDNNYDFVLNDGTLTINKAPLTVTVDDQSRIYGDENPELTFSYAGFKNGEDKTVLDTEPSISTTATTTTNVGTAAIALSGGRDNNYNYIFNDGVMSIDKALLIIRADDKIREYGDANPLLTASYEGFKNGEDEAVLDEIPNRVTSANETTEVGVYAIGFSGGSDNNYTLETNNGTLTITKAPLIVTGKDIRRAFETENPPLEIAYSGFKNGEDASVLDERPVASTTANISSALGTYAIELKGGSDTNYSLTLIPGILTVIDITPPEIISLVRLEPDQLNNNKSTADFRITFSEPVMNVSSSSFEVETTGSATGTIGSFNAISSDTYEITVNGISGQGTVGLKVSADQDIEDLHDNALVKPFSGEVYTINWIPTAIQLNPNSIEERNSIGAVIGSFTTSDLDANDQHEYALVSGVGDADNASFSLDGDQLIAEAVYDFEIQNTYSIRVKTDDGNGGVFEQEVTVLIDPTLIITGSADFETTIVGFSTSQTWTAENRTDRDIEVRLVGGPQGFTLSANRLIVPAKTTLDFEVVFTPRVPEEVFGDLLFEFEGGTETLPVNGEGTIVTGVENPVMEKIDIKMYPNPVKDQVTIDLRALENRELDIQMLDSNGKKVYSIKSYTDNYLILPVSAYASGLYIMEFTDGKSLVRKKLIIRK